MHMARKMKQGREEQLKQKAREVAAEIKALRVRNLAARKSLSDSDQDALAIGLIAKRAGLDKIAIERLAEGHAVAAATPT